MARDFAGVTHSVNFGSAASLDDVFTGTIFVWLWRDSEATPDTVLDKDDGLDFFLRFGIATTITFQVARATQSLRIEDEVPAYGLGKWLCVAATWTTTGADGDQRLYGGDLSTLLAEAATYTLQRAGTGAPTSNAAASLFAGLSDGAAPGDEFPFDGKIALVALWNRQLTLGELRQQQFRPQPTNGCVLFSHLGWGATDADLSGSGNNGTVTNTTVVDHVPLGFPFGYGVGAGAGGFTAPPVGGGSGRRRRRGRRIIAVLDP